MKARLSILSGTGLAAGAALLSAGIAAVRQEGASASAEAIATGRAVYEAYCAACHGAQFEGHSDWQSPLPSGRLPAPPHDASGHTWHHPDGILLRIIRNGSAAVVGNGYESDMPGFGDVLTDAEIRAVLAFIKSTWPERERAYQEQVSDAT